MKFLEIFKALGDTNRIRILNLLMKEELCVCEIETLLDLTQSNVSRHLNKLKTADIISSYKQSQWVHYKISNTLKENNMELYQYLNHKFILDVNLCKDIKRLQIYKNSAFSCEDIRRDKNTVLQYLE